MSKKTVLITGCSTGIGHDAAVDLTRRGYQVIASCRKQEDLNKLKSLGLDAVLMDVNDEQSLTTAFAEVLQKTGGRLDVLINNAGYGQAGALEDISRETLRQQFETNVFGLMDLTRLAIPVMRKQGAGRIINISSLLGFVSLPFRGAYNASKYAVEGLSDTLRLELKASGIEVICIQPGPIQSRFRDNAIDNSLKKIDQENSQFHQQYQKMLQGYRKQKEDSIFTRDTDVVICKLLHAIEARRPKAKYPVTFPSHLFAVLKRVLSARMLDRLMGFLSRKEL